MREIVRAIDRNSPLTTEEVRRLLAKTGKKTLRKLIAAVNSIGARDTKRRLQLKRKTARIKITRRVRRRK